MCQLIPYDPTVKALFEETELSQREAAARLGVSPALVNQLLNRGTLPKTGWAGLKKGSPLCLKSAAHRPPLSTMPSANWNSLPGMKIPPPGIRRKARNP